MRLKPLVISASIILSGNALALTPHVNCAGCTTLTQFGNFGAAQLYRATGLYAPAVGADRIWVDNPNTGRSVFVDVDTPFSSTSVMGIPVFIPDLTKIKINATWADGSATAIYTVPREVIGAQAGAIEAAQAHGPGNQVTAAEFQQLPGFDLERLWQVGGVPLGNLGRSTLSLGDWVFFSTSRLLGNPLVTIYECAWSDIC